MRALLCALTFLAATPALAVVDVALLGGITQVSVDEGENFATAHVANLSVHIAPFFTVPIAFGAYGVYGQDRDTNWRSLGPEVMGWLPFPRLRPYAKVSTPFFSETSVRDDQGHEVSRTSTEHEGRDYKRANVSAGLRWSSTALLPAPALMLEYRQGLSKEELRRELLFGLGAEL